MKLILASHGKFADALLKSASLIVGKIPNTVSIGLEPSMGPEDLKTKIESEIDSSDDEQILVGIDLLGGTPSNVSVQLLASHPSIEVISGFNLPMVIEFANQSMIGGPLSIDNICKMGIDGIVDVKKRLSSDSDDE